MHAPESEMACRGILSQQNTHHSLHAVPFYELISSFTPSLHQHSARPNTSTRGGTFSAVALGHRGTNKHFILTSRAASSARDPSGFSHSLVSPAAWSFSSSSVMFSDLWHVSRRSGQRSGFLREDTVNTAKIDRLGIEVFYICVSWGSKGEFPTCPCGPFAPIPAENHPSKHPCSALMLSGRFGEGLKAAGFHPVPKRDAQTPNPAIYPSRK